MALYPAVLVLCLVVVAQSPVVWAQQVAAKCCLAVQALWAEEVRLPAGSASSPVASVRHLAESALCRVE